jgi:hypothetical protein
MVSAVPAKSFTVELQRVEKAGPVFRIAATVKRVRGGEPLR